MTRVIQHGVDLDMAPSLLSISTLDPGNTNKGMKPFSQWYTISYYVTDRPKAYFKL